MFAFKTIRDGERAAVWDDRGRVRMVNGPARIWLHRRTVQMLQLHAAGADEYLVIQLKDGRSQHLHGPAAVWFHPIEHAAIRVEKAITIDANEALVVYARNAEHVARRVVRGPEQFMPLANEWLHEFRWHGADPQRSNRKVPRGLQFKKLRVIPDQMYFDVEDVRTADDALLIVRLMIFFELLDIERMLDRTHDPVADFINGVTADVIEFAASLHFEQFKEQTERLNAIETYPQLVQRTEQIGYRVSKVVYRGYAANPKLQQMHDGAIEGRTKLRLEAETERQSQSLADLKLAREAERAKQRREMEEGDLHHQNRLKRMAHDEELRRQTAAREQELAAMRATNELELAHLKETDQARLAFLNTMQGMQVDLTRYLVAQYQHPDRLIRIDAGTGRAAQLHLHQG